MGIRDRIQRWREVRKAIREHRLAEYHKAKHGTHVMDIEWQRSEELRPDRLGPSEADVRPDPPDRPRRTLGPLPRR